MVVKQTHCRQSAMSQVTIYTKPYCPYCIRAVELLETKGIMRQTNGSIYGC